MRNGWGCWNSGLAAEASMHYRLYSFNAFARAAAPLRCHAILQQKSVASFLLLPPMQPTPNAKQVPSILLARSEVCAEKSPPDDNGNNNNNNSNNYYYNCFSCRPTTVTTVTAAAAAGKQIPGPPRSGPEARKVSASRMGPAAWHYPVISIPSLL